jgi:tRNA dimethylallyltransferase
MLINPRQKTVIIILGPTASGKTAAAIAMAERYKTEIISADSRQCFRELNIGVARPTPEELNTIPHHFIATHSIHDEVTAAVFEQYALTKAAELFVKHDVVVMAGGTGLYIKAFCEGLDTIPAIPAAIRDTIIQTYNEKGLPWLQEQVKEKDPSFFETGEIQNPQRMMRALEVAEFTGKSILSFRRGKKEERAFTIVKLGIDLPKEELHRRIHYRADQMIEHGLVEEVKHLQPYQHLNALQTVGYKEIFEFLENKITLEKAIEDIKTNTRQYAKRQMTWFKKDAAVRWNEDLIS